MKKIYLLAIIFVSFIQIKAQETTPEPEKKHQDIEALKVAFISRELDLTPEEAQKFWPIFNQYTKEVNTAITNKKEVLERDEEVLNIRKRYKEQFTKVIGQKRMNKMYGAEGKFRQVLINVIKRQKIRQLQNGTRPGIRRNGQ
jgi:Spy/CpxP family protein refolding chaperone